MFTETTVSFIERYVPPVLLLLGLFGNLMSLCILLNPAMMRQTTNMFLAVLAVADCIVLLVGLLPDWAENLSGVDIQHATSLLCKSVTLLTYSSSHFSVWIIVVVTIMRYIAVSEPHQASKFCNHKIAKRLIALLVFSIIMINLHIIWTVDLKTSNQGFNVIKKCDAKEGFGDFIYTVWPWIDASIFALAPFLLLVFFNTRIIVTTLKATSWRHKNQHDKANSKRIMSRNNIKLTITLLTVSFSFLVTTLPMATVMILQIYWNWKLEESGQELEVLSQQKIIRTVAEMLMYLNHSINFFLYCAVGEKFRVQMAKTFCRHRLSKTNTSDHSCHRYCLRHHQHYVGKESSGSSWL